MALFPKVIAPEGVHGRHIYSIPRLLSLEGLIVCVSCAAKAQAWFSFIGRSHERTPVSISESARQIIVCRTKRVFLFSAAASVGFILPCSLRSAEIRAL